MAHDTDHVTCKSKVKVTTWIGQKGEYMVAIGKFETIPLYFNNPFFLKDDIFFYILAKI